jgi:hypothetical protein
MAGDRRPGDVPRSTVVDVEQPGVREDEPPGCARQIRPVPSVIKSLKPILYAGALVGVLDLTAACINAGIVSGATPTRVLKSVAGGLLGRSAYEGGFGTVALGLVLHFTMALTVATVFYVLSRLYPALLRHAVPAGLLYGLAVFVVNNFGTAPLLSWFRSLYLHTPILFKPPMGWSQLVIHMFCVGLPIALVLRRYANH